MEKQEAEREAESEPTEGDPGSFKEASDRWLRGEQPLEPKSESTEGDPGDFKAASQNWIDQVKSGNYKPGPEPAAEWRPENSRTPAPPTPKSGLPVNPVVAWGG